MKISDVIHGDFEIPTLVEAVVKTPLFQRLKEIHQLGCLYFIVPEAINTRYEHCLGTYFVAEQMLNHLEANTEGLKIPHFYRQCVAIAGLLHDIGHGPFSHCWENVNKSRTHERNAYDCIDEIFLRRGNRLDADEVRNLLAVDIIKSLINPVDHELKKRVTSHSQFDSNFMFIYEIISNKKCELDVDKADYLLRDNHYLDSCRLFPRDLTNQKFCVHKKDIKDIFYNARVSDDRQHVEYRTSDFGKIYHLFDTRSQFHISMYQYPECLLVERLLAELVAKRDSKATPKLCEIDSRDVSDFLRLTDGNVTNEFDENNDPVFRKIWRALKNKSFTETTSENPSSYEIDIKIDYAGTKMREEDIPFFGAISDKPYVKQIKGAYEKTYHYAIIDSNNNDS